MNYSLPELSDVCNFESGYFEDFTEERKNKASENLNKHFDSSENKFPIIAQILTIQSFLEKQILQSEKKIKELLFNEIEVWAERREFSTKSKTLELLKSEFISGSLDLFGGDINNNVSYNFIESEEIKNEILQFHHLIQFINFAINEKCFITKFPVQYIEIIQSKDDLEFLNTIHDNTVALRVKHSLISLTTTFHFQFESDSDWLKIDYDNYEKTYNKNRSQGASEKDGFTQSIINERINIFFESEDFHKSKFWVKSGGVLHGSIVVRELAKYLIYDILNCREYEETDLDPNVDEKTVENKINANPRIQKYLPKTKRLENRKKKK